MKKNLDCGLFTSECPSSNHEWRRFIDLSGWQHFLINFSIHACIRARALTSGGDPGNEERLTHCLPQQWKGSKHELCPLNSSRARGRFERIFFLSFKISLCLIADRWRELSGHGGANCVVCATTTHRFVQVLVVVAKSNTSRARGKKRLWPASVCFKFQASFSSTFATSVCVRNKRILPPLLLLR